MKRIFVLLLIALLPGLAHADLANELNSNGLNDLSFAYLQDIFGVVDGILHGTGTQIMGAMFKEFNNAVLSLGFVIMSYVFFVSTINTAHEGDVMGKRWSSIWIPLRVVGSTALIVPKASGYCAMQIFVMGVVVSGVAAADQVMNAALTYIQQGGVLIQSSPPPVTNVVQLGGSMLKSLTCMNGAYNAVVNIANANQAQAPAPFVPDSAGYAQGSSFYVDFPSADAQYNSITFQGLCGSVSWDNSSVDTSSNAQNNDTSNPSDMRNMAVEQMIADLQPTAQAFANALVPLTGAQSSSAPTVENVVSANTISLILAAADYTGIMLPYFTERYEAFQQSALNVISQTQGQGWIMLGSLYFNLAQLNNNVNGNDSSIPKAYFQQKSASSSPPDVSGAWNLLATGSSTNYQNILFCNPVGNTSCTGDVLSSKDVSSLVTGNTIDDYITSSINANKNAGGLYQAGAIQSGGYGGGGAVAQAGELMTIIISPIIAPIYAIIYNMQALFDGQNQNTDPIIAISGIGSALVNLVTTLWFGVAGLLFAATFVIGIVPCVNSGGFSVLSFLMWFVPTFSALLIGMFVSGATMAFYVPLIPFILFTFAALGWFATVFEAMIAAPLVALGLASPEGHEMLGKAEQSINLLMSVFLRPVLMVFGFFGGAVLSHVGLWLLNKGFGVAWGYVVLYNVGNLGIAGVLWSFIAALIIYMSLVLAIINQTFGLIHQLPDELLRWLGGGVKALGTSPETSLANVKSDFEGAHKTAGAGMQAMTEGALKEQGKEGGSTDGKIDIKGGK